VSGWIEHAGAAIVIGVSVALLWRPPALRSSSDAEKEERVGELAGLLGQQADSRAEIERILPAASRFPPNEQATRSLADALSMCNMSGLSESSRLLLARRLYAITAGDDLPRDRLLVMLNQIQNTAIDARCSPIVIDAMVGAAQRVARTDPKPRKDWW
jgi:hypothetical protein